MNSEVFSMGTKPVFDKLQELISTNRIDTVCLNIDTVIRNCSSNSNVKQAVDEDKQQPTIAKSVNVLYDESKQELVNFVQDVSQLFNSNNLVHNPKLIVYQTDYSKCISSEIYRIPPPSKQLLTTTTNVVREKLVSGKRKETMMGKTMVVEYPMTGNICPWKYLADELKYTKNNHNVVVISSHPVDYHFGLHCSRFELLRSYTGELVPYKQLGTTVFNTDALPFNRITHALLGDKENVKPTVTGKAKTKLLEIASEEEWILKTEEYIKNRVYQLDVRIPSTFN